jgi:hypothetical protein
LTTLKDAIDLQVNDLLEKHVKEVVASYTHLLTKKVQVRVDDVLNNVITNIVKDVEFPDDSIKPSAIDWTDFQLSINQVQGARELAQATVKETINTDYLEVDVAEVGMLILKRGITTDTPGFKSIVDAVTDKIPPTPPAHIDYSQIKIPDYTGQFKEIKEEFNKSIKLRGHLPQLEVSGEATLSDVLYTTPGTKRVGINTIDPSDALTVWDNEVEVVMGKHKAQEGYIGTRRRQDINIGANNKVGITVRSDGSVAIDKLQLMGRTLETSNSVPGEARKKGDITLNSNPQIGSPIGWVCLDGLRWSGFGKIEE